MNIHAIRVSLLLWALPLAVLAQAPSTDGLIAYWKFDETSGTTANDRAGNYNATLNSGASFAPGQGQSGGALQLNDLTGGATVPSFDLSGSAITISAWVKANVTTSNATRRIVGKTNPDNSNDYSFALNVTSQGAVEVRFLLNGANANTSTRGKAIVEGQWHHIAATYDGSTVALYLDGTLVTTSNRTGALLNTTNMKLGIGNRPEGATPDHPFDGMIDELRVYDRSLSGSEVNNLTTTEAYRQLPVTFTSFQATPAFSGVELYWTVEDQRDNAGFAVERATGNAGVFTEVGFVAAHAHGDYSYTDYSAPAEATLYYRLRQVDHDGSEMYSSLVTVAPQQRNELTVFPNPASASVTVSGSGAYVILDGFGRRVASGTVVGQERVAVADLPAGTYTLMVNQQATRFVKQ